MLLPTPQFSGTLVKRYKRFLADVVPHQHDAPPPSPNNLVTLHCPNSGSMKGLTTPGNRVWYHESPNKARKLPYTWDLVEDDTTLVGINTTYPNKLVHEALLARKLSPFCSYTTIQPEAVVEKGTRLDFKLSDQDQRNIYIEVKNVTLKMGQTAQFPDAVTERGTKHLQSLMTLVANGHRGALVFVVQRDDVISFTPAKDIDPTYAAVLSKAMLAGVEVYAYTCEMSLNSITLNTHQDGLLPVDI